MSVLPQPLRHDFTPETEPRDIETIQPVFDRLVALPTDTPERLKAFLRAWDEFDAWIEEHVGRTRIQTMRHTDDDEGRAHWMHLVAKVIPETRRWKNQLDRKLLESPALDSLEGTDFERFVDQVRTGAKLFREENVPLLQELQELRTRYNEISGAWTVEFDGEERTMSGMLRYLSSADREVRRAAWEAMECRKRQDAEELDDLFDRMVELRRQVAHNAGFDDYRAYIFEEKLRDYSPEDCLTFHELVEAEVMPVAEEIARRTAEGLGLDSYRPWDAFADPGGGESLRPFESVDELEDGVEEMIRRLDPELGELFAEMRPNFDLGSRPNKAQGGFMCPLPFSRRPFIFANASGSHLDVVVLLHEAGHAFHTVASVDRRPMSAIQVPMEFNEVASMAMELLPHPSLEVFYGDEEERTRAIHEHLRRVVTILPRVCVGDAWQHWLYTQPETTAEQRGARWAAEEARFGLCDWSEIAPEHLEQRWHGILHFFLVPFYFIEYGFAQLGALQIAMGADRNPDEALAAYKSALSLGATRDVQGLYAEAGAQFVPTQERLRELMDWVRGRLFG